MTFISFFLAALATTTVASHTSDSRVLHEKRQEITTTKSSRVAHDAIIPIRIGLKQTNLDNGYDMLMDVSDPASENYGNHWSVDEVDSYFAPLEESIEAVKAWLVDSGIDHKKIGHSDDKQWIAVNLPAGQAEELLAAEYHEYHSLDEYIRIGCDEYHLPLNISRHVDYIRPGVFLSPPIHKTKIKRDLLSISLESDPSHQSHRDEWWKRPGAIGPRPPPLEKPWHGPHPPLQHNATFLPADLRYCGYNLTPPCVRALYNIPKNHFNTSEHILAVASFDQPTYGEGYSQADLNEYFRMFAPYVPQGTHPMPIDRIDGGHAPVSQRKAGGEAELDFEVVFPLVYPQKVTLYQVGYFNMSNYTSAQLKREGVPFLTLLDAVDGSFCTEVDRRMGLDCGKYSLTQVVSVSYAGFELFSTQLAAVRFCNEIMKLSLQGHTFVFASGDYGVAGYAVGDINFCLTRDLKHLNGTIFQPTFPSVCPYVLSVGGTQIYANETVKDPEYVMNLPQFSPPGNRFCSGGGFSNYFKRPSYQDTAVEHYLTNYVPDYRYYIYNGHDPFSNKSNIGAHGGRYNRAGRGFPDVSSNGANYTIVSNGQVYDSGGTSQATPIWSSIIALLNQERAKIGKGPVGFINPALYAHPEAFTDITRGNNPGCGTQGFPAVPGWDPSSGLGTPDYPKLLKLFTGLGGWQKGRGSTKTGHKGWSSSNETAEHANGGACERGSTFSRRFAPCSRSLA